MKKIFLITGAIILIIILLLEASPFIKFKIFQMMNQDWIKSTSFQIVKTDVVCSRIGPGFDKLAQLNITYKYFYENRKQIKTQNNVVTVYKLYFFEGCQDFKNQVSIIWNKYKNDNKIELWINKNNINQSKILILDKNIEIRSSKICLYISEIQGFFGSFIFIIILLFTYLILKKK